MPGPCLAPVLPSTTMMTSLVLPRGGQMATGTTSPTPTGTRTATMSSSKRPPRSKVWTDFDELTHLVNGKRVRYGAVCKYCNVTLSGKSSSGTGHLLRHNCSAKKEQQRDGIVQFVLKYNSDGSLKHWEYSPSVARTELYRLIAKEDLPLWFGESDAFQGYISNAHNPKFTKSSRQTTARDMVKLYNERVVKMRGFHKILLRLSTLTGTDNSRLPQKVRSQLTNTFQLYESKFGDVRLRAQHQMANANEGRNKMAWDDIYGDDDFDCASSASQYGARSVTLSPSSMKTSTS